jgi:hypothetical protein
MNYRELHPENPGNPDCDWNDRHDTLISGVMGKVIDPFLA